MTHKLNLTALFGALNRHMQHSRLKTEGKFSQTVFLKLSGGESGTLGDLTNKHMFNLKQYEQQRHLIADNAIRTTVLGLLHSNAPHFDVSFCSFLSQALQLS